ncbi:hypothetical protein ACFOSV_14655 [Algoriphagus namhaensis]|uniref:Uncharacterized protein n=1 Tax=Algoriphagus namhaensis TaxID=915353 RepID=A0ABV8ATV0_9BACT
MEKITLSELANIITEEIYLLPEDRAMDSNEATHQEALEDKSPKQEPAPQQPVENEEAEQVSVVMEPKLEPIKISGSFNQGILILHEEEELSGEIMTLLSNIINAVNHSMNDVGLVASSQLAGRSLEELYDLGAHKIVKFGRIRHGIDALPAPDYQVYTENETEFLFADALTSIQEDKALKGKLWKALQSLFNITK